MNSKELDSRLGEAFSNISPNVLESVLRDAGQQKGRLIDIKSPPKIRRPAYKRFMQAAAILLLCLLCIGGVGVYNTASAEYATVTIDAAAPLELSLNKDGKIRKISSPSDELLTLMKENDIKGMEILAAVEPISRLLIEGSLVSPDSNSLLISVEAESPREAEGLEDELKTAAYAAFEAQGFNASVMAQIISEGEELSELSSDLQISPGKARLVSSIAGSSGRSNAEALAELSVNDLNIIIGCTGRGPEDLDILGKASMGLYLGEDTARLSAEAVSGINPERLKSYDVVLSYDDGALYYTVNLDSDIYSFNCLVNALSGEVSEESRKYNPVLEDWYNSQDSELRQMIRENLDDLDKLLRSSKEELESMLANPATGNRVVDEIIPKLADELLSILSF